MRRIFAILLISALPLAASAQNENVIVSKSEPLSGLWRISFPRMEMSLGFGGIRFLGSNTFCRISDPDKNGEYTVRCLSAFGGNGTATLDGSNLHIAWGIPIARIVLDTTTQDPRAFTGVFGIKLFGIKHEAEERSVAKKFILADDAVDSAEKGEILSQILGQLAQGAITMSNDPAMSANIGGRAAANSAAEIQDLGKVEAVLYLGDGSIRRVADGKEIEPFAYSAYQVEFTNGQRLCGIHQREDGLLDGFLCV